MTNKTFYKPQFVELYFPSGDCDSYRIGIQKVVSIKVWPTHVIVEILFEGGNVNIFTGVPFLFKLGTQT